MDNLLLSRQKLLFVIIRSFYKIHDTCRLRYQFQGKVLYAGWELLQQNMFGWTWISKNHWHWYLVLHHRQLSLTKEPNFPLAKTEDVFRSGHHERHELTISLSSLCLKWVYLLFGQWRHVPQWSFHCMLIVMGSLMGRNHCKGQRPHEIFRYVNVILFQCHSVQAAWSLSPFLFHVWFFFRCFSSASHRDRDKGLDSWTDRLYSLKRSSVLRIFRPPSLIGN